MYIDDTWPENANFCHLFTNLACSFGNKSQTKPLTIIIIFRVENADDVPLMLVSCLSQKKNYLNRKPTITKLG